MAWTAPATATAGSILTAAWLNTYLRDNSLILKTSINDDGTLNPIRRLKANSGSSSSTAANVSLDSVVLPVLTALDTIEIDFGFTVGTSITTAGLTLRHLTDGANICKIVDGATLNAGERVTGSVILSQDQGGNTLINVLMLASNDAHRANASVTERYAATALWSSAWTLSLNLNNQSAGSTTWRWKVYLKAGQ